MKHEDFLRIAIRLADENIIEGNGGPFGALVVKDGKIISSGANSVLLLNDPTAHAEIMAIRKACQVLNHFQLEGCTIYSSCEPCPMCLGAIYWARPERIIYAATREDASAAGFDDSLIYRELSVPQTERMIPAYHIPVSEVYELFNSWEHLEKKTLY